MGATLTSPSLAQAPPPLGTVANFAVLGGSTVTNTGPTVIIGTPSLPGHVGVSPGAAITGFPPGIVTPPGAIHAADAVAGQAQVDLTIAYNNLVGRTTTVNLTGQNLGGLTLVPGVYNFDASAQLTGTLTLNALGNPNAVFIINIGSSLTTASASSVLLINGAQGGNVFWRVGSSATLGTTTSFAGDILAQASITLNTGASITCGAAWARTGAVTLDTNTISLCALLTGTGTVPGAPGGPIVVIGPTGFPLFASLLPLFADGSQRAVAGGLDNAINNGVTLPLAFVNLFNLPPGQLAAAFSQLQGEPGTGTAQAGTQAMNAFLSLVTNPFDNNRGFSPESPPRPPLIYKAMVHKAAAVPAPRHWHVWAAAYGGQNKTIGDPVVVGSHDRTTRTYGVAAGLDYRVSPYTAVGFALGGGGTDFGLAGGFGGGRSDMFQAALSSTTRVNAAYVSAAIAYAWHDVSTERFLTVAGTDHLTAEFSAHSVGGRIEGGYRFIIPGILGMPGVYGVTPYAAGQVQSFRTPSYSEGAAFGSPIFALAYEARTITTIRSELGAWFDWSTRIDDGAALTLRTRAAWAHDQGSDPSINASFVALPGSRFTEFGAAPARDSVLASASAEISFSNRISLAGKFDSELANRSQTFIGTARLRYTW